MSKILFQLFYLALLWSTLIQSNVYSSSPSYPYSEMIRDWQKEVNESFKSNFHGSCDWSLGINNYQHKRISNEKTLIRALVYYPKLKEVNDYESKPLSLSRGNSKLIDILKTKNIVQWSEEKGMYYINIILNNLSLFT